MAKVSLGMKSHPLSREENGVEFEIHANDGAKIGELVVSKGGVRWKPKGQHDHFFADWKKFNKIMSDAGLKKK
ncbi:hypothetical protein H1W37_16150 [Stappia taiwanensis]|uniref:Uncharacterized protein n=1 Tax=Stappia taiwanensis TaxID=992267 RepID=A0A838Y1W7_9HYPH|nr:hypothetical protein [Stappia taiwanensis]MBA4613194.1 hypothetical protein [Stappia taiwanensis]GGE79612.1 hypothetical protein GCM10007285_04290 [Stappia taiwanensis]